MHAHRRGLMRRAPRLLQCDAVDGWHSNGYTAKPVSCSTADGALLSCTLHFTPTLQPPYNPPYSMNMRSRHTLRCAAGGGTRLGAVPARLTARWKRRAPPPSHARTRARTRGLLLAEPRTPQAPRAGRTRTRTAAAGLMTCGASRRPSAPAQSDGRPALGRGR
jgi:hypothetical protein